MSGSMKTESLNIIKDFSIRFIGYALFDVKPQKYTRMNLR